MSYYTQFDGVLKFSPELTIPALAKLNTILGQDVRKHKGWDITKNQWLTYIDLELTKNLDGIKWNGSENTRQMEQLINVVIRQMRKDFPNFGLSGVLRAQGEEMGDIYEVYIGEDGFAQTRDLNPLSDKPITCPHCRKTFTRDDN